MKAVLSLKFIELFNLFMKKIIILALPLFFCLFQFQKASAQTTDLARLEYTYIPFTKGKNTVQRFRSLVQIPIPLDKDRNNLIVVGLEYRNLPLDFKDEVPFDTKTLQSVQRIEGSLSYVYRLPNTNWRVAVKGGLRLLSNFDGKMVPDDYIYEGAVYAINDMFHAENPKPYRWIFGLIYNTAPGRNYPLPLVNYHREINDTWNYTLGVPKTNLRYKFNGKNAIQIFAEIDHFFANIQKNIKIQNKDKLGQNISMTNVELALGYEHYFTKHLLYYAYAGYTVYNDYRIRDNDHNKIYVIENGNSPYFRSGIKFKL